MKEKHPIYRMWLVLFYFFLALGTLLLVYSLITGQGAEKLLFQSVIT